MKIFKMKIILLWYEVHTTVFAVLADKYNSQDGVQWFADDVRMKWTLTQQPTTNVSVMAMTVYPTFGQSLLVDGILLVLFIPM